MSLSYTSALGIILSSARTRMNTGSEHQERVPLLDALGRQAAEDLRSPINTPLADSSAMDGYAVSSELTICASSARPLRLVVKGIIAAGDAPLRLTHEADDEGRIPCVEIMTGAPFPQSLVEGPGFDACIPWEHTRLMSTESKDTRVVEIVRPAKHNQHRRLAGNDFHSGDVIVFKGSRIGLQHIMAGASVGIEVVDVQRRLKASLITTGCELQQSHTKDATQLKIKDCNGPFLRTALCTLGLEVTYVSGVPDIIEDLQNQMLKAISRDNCDILITTGGVSVGKFDFVPQAILGLGGSVNFHHIAMRPGHPVLFASLPSRRNARVTREIAIFGVPGNPIAAAACYRFLVVPYICALRGECIEPPRWKAEVSKDEFELADDPERQSVQYGEVIYRNEKALDRFLHGQVRSSSSGHKVTLSSDQSPAKLRPFGRANCWMHVPAGVSEVRVGDKIDCYALSAP